MNYAIQNLFQDVGRIESLLLKKTKKKDVRNVKRKDPQGHWQMQLLAQNLKVF